MSITRTKKGYTIRWYDVDGRERQRTYKGIDRPEAERLERKILAERDRGEQPPDERQAPTFGALANQWVEESRSGWKPSTRMHYEQVIKSMLRPAFGELRITNVSESLVRQLITKLRDRGLSARRINLVLTVLGQIVRTARRRRLLRDDPLAAVKMLREPRTEVDPLSPEEITAFLDACPKWWRPYFIVAFWTGARPGELGALKWGTWTGPRGGSAFAPGAIAATRARRRRRAACATSTFGHEVRNAYNSLGYGRHGAQEHLRQEVGARAAC
jgi:integrase